MSDEHTPGPWRVEWQSPCYWLIRDPDVHLPPGDAADDPNRLLIERAPETKKQRDELLAVLRAVKASISDSLAAFAVPVNDSLSDALDAIDATINDATMKEEA